MHHLTNLICVLPIWLFSQQIVDTGYHPPISCPEYDRGKGPIIFIDEGHHNFHTKEGRYKAFANLLEGDGYQVHPYVEILKKMNSIEGRSWSFPMP